VSACLLCHDQWKSSFSVFKLNWFEINFNSSSTAQRYEEDRRRRCGAGCWVWVVEPRVFSFLTIWLEEERKEVRSVLSELVNSKNWWFWLDCKKPISPQQREKETSQYQANTIPSPVLSSHPCREGASETHWGREKFSHDYCPEWTGKQKIFVLSLLCMQSRAIVEYNAVLVHAFKNLKATS